MFLSRKNFFTIFIILCTTIQLQVFASSCCEIVSCIKKKQNLIHNLLKQYGNAFALYRILNNDLKILTTHQQTIISEFMTIISHYSVLTSLFKQDEHSFSEIINTLNIHFEDIIQKINNLTLLNNNNDTQLQNLLNTIKEENNELETIKNDWCQNL